MIERPLPFRPASKRSKLACLVLSMGACSMLMSATGLMLPTLALAAELAPDKVLRIEMGQQQTLPHHRPISRAAVGDPSTLGLSPVGPSGLLITGKKPGSTTVTIWDSKETSPARQITVVVSPNLAPLRAAMPQGSKVKVEVSGPVLRLSGEMKSLEEHDHTTTAAKAILPAKSSTLIDGTQQYDVQVQIDIKILEVSRQRLKEAGLHLNRLGASGVRGLAAPGTFGGYQTRANGQLQFSSIGGSVPFSDAFNVFSAGRNTIAIFSALENNGFAYSLAEPSLTAISGQTATFLAGGELPIPLSSGVGSVSVEFKPFGIRVNLTPFVIDNQRIVLKVAPEVSELDETISARAGNFVVPGLRVRRTETTVSLGDGETFVISGLMNRNTKSVVNKFPVLGDIPILGAFFKSTRFEKDDQELLMIATPHLVRPFAKNAPLPALPGEEAGQYSPSLPGMMLRDSGASYDRLTGFSK